jgi:excinuclease ABC subunit C
MKDQAGKVLYVGKAVNLRARVRTYFNGTDGRRRMHQLMLELAQLDVSLAADEREALLLEARLIRHYQPKYNIALRNSFRPTSLRIDLRHPFPRVERRARDDDGAHYFGPLPSSWHAGQILAVLERHFPLRTCDDLELTRRTRPCLQFQLKRCLAPCVGKVTPDAYRQMLDALFEVLEGGEARLADQLRREMAEASGRLDFEYAAIVRDRLRGLEGLQAKAPPPVAGVDRDVLGLAREADAVAISIMPVRWGRQQEARVYCFEGQVTDDADLLATFLLQRYQRAADLPTEIVLPFALPGEEAVASILAERAERPLKVSQPPDAAGLDQVAAAQAELAVISDASRSRARKDAALRRLGDPLSPD